MIHKTRVVSLHWSAVFSPDAVQLHGNKFTVFTVWRIFIVLYCKQACHYFFSPLLVWRFALVSFSSLGSFIRLCIKLGQGQGDGDIGTRVTRGRETRDLGTSSMGRGDVWNGDAGRQIQGRGGRGM